MQERIKRIIRVAQMTSNDDRDALATFIRQTVRALPKVAAKSAELFSLKLSATAEKLCGIGACLQNHLIEFTNHQQRAMRLDGASQVDLFAFTVR